MEKDSIDSEVKPAKFLIEFGEKVDQALEKAVADAIQKHQRAGNTIAVWRNQKIQIINAEKNLS